MKAIWQRMTDVAELARRNGHLLSIPNEFQIVEDGGVPFVVRYAPQLIEKIKASKAPKRDNPFLPPEPELTVGPIGDKHQLILNKFNVLECHGLIVTNEFVEQTDQLALDDFAAVSQVLTDTDGLIFYNGGERAGASQRHRHFQIVPKDMGAGVLPIQQRIESLAHPERQALFPFQYRFFALPDWSPETLFDAWLKLEFAWQPYNLLISQQWMLVVPRHQESVHGISMNSLAFAGALLAKNQQEMDIILSTGPIALLQQVCCSGK